MKNQIDTNDLQYVRDRGHQPLGWVAGAIDKETGKINPQVTKMYLGDNKYISVFHVKPVYYETTAGTWRPLGEICSYHGNKRIELNTDWRKAHPRFINWLTKRQALLGSQLLLPTPFGFIPSQYQDQVRPTVHVGLTTTTVYPDPSPETTTVDGEVYHDNGTWATAHDAGTGSGANDSSTGTFYAIRCDRAGGGGTTSTIGRGITLFDTSSIDDGDTIDSATNSYRGDNKTGSSYSAGVVQSNPASNTAITTADYSAFTVHEDTPASDADITVSAWNNAGYNDYTFNATGLSWITKTGVTKLGMRISHDYTETSGHANGNPTTTQTFVGYRKADYAGTDNDPKLAVVHTAGSSPVNSNFFVFM